MVAFRSSAHPDMPELGNTSETWPWERFQAMEEQPINCYTEEQAKHVDSRRDSRLNCSPNDDSGPEDDSEA